MIYLVTGGLGFIGSHVCVELLNQKDTTVVIVDNLCNSKLSVLDNIRKILMNNNNYRESSLIFYQMDILDTNMECIFEEYKFDAVLHFAALKSVSESNQKPELYTRNNELGTKRLLQLMKQYECNNFIFSSSATVYGTNTYPVNELSPTGEGLTNVYAHNKYNIEEYIKKLSLLESYCDFSFMILRYFNPIGAHPSGLIGENPNDIPNNLFPYILKVATGELKELTVFGNDYDTEDGTCLRDYIHVCDLADGHIKVLKHINDTGVHIYNLGTGNGTSVLQLVNAFNNQVKSNDTIKKVNYNIGERRDGDLEIVYTETMKANKELKWIAKYSIDDMCSHGINFIKNQINHVTCIGE